MLYILFFKAKQKPIEELKLESLGINLKSNLSIVKTEAPSVRKGGVMVESVDQLIQKLKNVAKVI